jgi:hypothetical protein
LKHNLIAQLYKRVLTMLAAMFSGVFMVAAGGLHPIVEVETGFLFGATLDGKWMNAGETTKLIQSGTLYRIYSVTERLGETNGSKPKSLSEVCPDTLEVSLSAKPARGVIALAAPWNALPRKPRTADTTQKVYGDAVGDFLKKRGIKEPKVKITRILRVDLEGDGEEEVLISATNYFSKDESVPSNAPAGSYSLVLLRRVTAGKVQTQLVAGEFYPTAKTFIAPNHYSVTAVLDLDGDGKLEVMVHSAYYEGGSTTIYRCEPGKNAKALLSVECGA